MNTFERIQEHRPTGEEAIFPTTEAFTLSSMKERVGNTPLALLDQFGETAFYAKLESENPTGSIKARTAYAMLADAVRDGRIGKKGIVINSGGNFALAVCTVAKAENIPVTVSLLSSAPDSYRATLEELDATVIAESDTRNERRDIALELEQEGSCFLDQHNSGVALAAIEKTLAPEIERQTEGLVTDVIAGFGTGMTAFGISRYFRHLDSGVPSVTITAVEDDLSLLEFHWRSLEVIDGTLNEKLAFLEQYKKESSRPFRVYRTKDGIGSILFYAGDRAVDDIPGIGISGLQPMASELLRQRLIDNVIKIYPAEAQKATRMLQRQGFNVGISSGATYLAAREIFAEKCQTRTPACIVAIFADAGTLYESVLYEENERKDTL